MVEKSNLPGLPVAMLTKEPSRRWLAHSQKNASMDCKKVLFTLDTNELHYLVVAA
jgi:hypothetical protein